MEIKDLLFFNKEGYNINANYNDELKLWHSKILFDKNSVDTFKTQALYLFEKVEGTENTFNSILEKFQTFNTNDFYFQPKNIDELEITNIKSVNIDSNYNTKWIYADNIEKYFYDGAWCYFENLDNYFNNDFDEYINNELNVFKVFKVEVGRILVFTDTTNDNVMPTFSLTNALIKPINVIEVIQNQEPTWNETNLNTLLYQNKKISTITGTNNDNVYSVYDIAKNNVRNEYILQPGIYTPNAGDTLEIELELRTSNIVVSNGEAFFDNNEIIVQYIPQYLNIGDTIRAQSNVSTSLLAANAVQLTVTNIDYTTNTITVTQALSNQIIDCTIVLTSNVFTMQQLIPVDNNNTYSLTLAYSSIVNTFNEELSFISGGYTLRYDDDTDELHILSEYTNNYSDITVNIIEQNNNVINLTGSVISNNYDVIPIVVNEQIQEQLYLPEDTDLYNRSIIFNNIDNFGLNITINGVEYNVNTDITINDTIQDWINEYQTPLNDLGIQVQQIGTNEINIFTDFPNVPIFIEMNMGTSSDYYIPYKDVQINNIKTQLLITINEVPYLVPFDTDDITTVNNWINTHQIQLSLNDILVTNTANVIHFRLLDPERQLNITYNIGYTPKQGDLSIYETLFATNNNGSVISGNEIIINTNNLLNYYSSGQKISISGADKILQNKSYNIISLTNDRLSLTYQGPYWNNPLNEITIVSDYFIRYPKNGFSNIGNDTTIKFTWKDTETPDFFLYDFSGTQLKPHMNGFPEYSGPIPLCGPNGEIELRLNKRPNKDIKYIDNPLRQQTVFKKLEYELPFLDVLDNPNIEPSPIQSFIGYKSDIETWNKARLYVELCEDLKFDLDTAINNDNLFVFKDNYVELQNSVGINFRQLGFKEDQIITFKSVDITDNKKLTVLDNDGIQYRIKSVQANKIYFTTDVVEETSIKEVPTDSAPFYNASTGDPILINRVLNVQIIVEPRIIAYFDIFGESEAEDERHEINISNRNKNLLKLQDFFIFKDVDIKEEGVDWTFMNRKRKELLEIYPELANYLSSYKSVIKAIDFFGYNDLIFAEYYQNINPESEKFGKLFNVELLNIFDKNVKGWKLNNLSTENLRNVGYKKTNLFSLNYKITDNDGNFINAYSLDEVKIKLLGLKKWLTDNIIPIGTKILDINGAYKNQDNYIIQHETYMTKNFNVEEYASPIDFTTKAYQINNTTNYEISVDFFSEDVIEWFEYTIKTFYADIWDETVEYLVNSYVIFNNQVWTNTQPTLANEQPELSTKWIRGTIDDLSNVQVFKDYKYNLNTNTSFTIDENIDPHFQIEVSYHSGYAIAHKTIKTYSLIPEIFEDLEN